MAATPSTMLELGTDAPDFTLPEPLTGNLVSLTGYSDQPLIIAFICNHCPYVIAIIEAFSTFAEQYRSQGLFTVAINANDAEKYTDDSPAKMIEFARKYRFSMPYLFDETQEVAKSYKAACTPDFFMFNEKGKLFYRGQFDSVRPGSEISATGENMRHAADALLNNLATPANQIASLGCNIKWKPGNEPDYCA